MRLRKRFRFAIALLILASACASETGRRRPIDADAEGTDAGSQIDAASPIDAASRVDAASAVDAASRVDAGSPTDVGSAVDAATRADAGAVVDASRETLDAEIALDAGSLEDGGSPVSLRMTRITAQHRYVPGFMFGGWGPHLGHLVRGPAISGSGTDLYWVDDLCDQTVAGDCDVNVNRRIGIFRLAATAWEQVETIALPAGVQQNTGAIATTAAIHVYGTNIASSRITECTWIPSTRARACVELPFPTGDSANYIGASRAPNGSRLVWWTNVRDAGGSFSYLIDYGGGWNGPRTGGVGGYNDCAYVHASFRPDGQAVTFFGQAVLGRAPDWTYEALVGEGSLTTATPVVWGLALADPPGRSVMSTNDLWIDDRTGDAHLLARTVDGAVAYYFRAAAGAWTTARFVEGVAFRARWLIDADRVALVSGPSDHSLRLRLFSRASMVPGAPLPIAGAVVERFTPGLGYIYGIYTEASSYQAAPVGGLSFVVVGEERQHQAYFVEVLGGAT